MDGRLDARADGEARAVAGQISIEIRPGRRRRLGRMPTVTELKTLYDPTKTAGGWARNKEKKVLEIVGLVIALGAIAGFSRGRFLVGRNRPSPTGSWICTNCSFTNAQHANICEACQQPWTPPQ